MKAEFTRADEKYVVGTIQNGRYQNFQDFKVYGLPDEWVGCPGVCITGDIGDELLTPDQAEQLAVLLVRAATAARVQAPADETNNVVSLR